MSLKLFKPNYKLEKLQSHLDLRLQSNQISNLTLKKLFVISSCKSTPPIVRLKKPVTKVDIHEHKYQLKTIFKLYNSTFLKKAKVRGNKNTFDASRRNYNSSINKSQSQSQSVNNLMITSLNPPPIDIINKRLVPALSNRNSKSILKQNRSLVQLGNNSNNNNSVYHLNKNDILFPNVLNYKKDISSRNRKSNDSINYSKNRSIDFNENDKDENAILNKLKKEYKFYLHNENKFEKKKWKIFQKNIELNDKIIPKHSIHWLNVLRRKKSSNCFQ